LNKHEKSTERKSQFALLTLARVSVLAIAILILVNAGVGEKVMTPRVVQQAGFTVVGISARTSNAKEMTADGVIGKQWGRLMQDGLLNRIPNRTDKAIVAVYTDYASDHNGEYTYVLGAKVTSDAQVPVGMVAKKIPAGRYAAFTSEKGPAAKVVPEAWMRINSLPKSAVGGDRVYRADFEIYDERASDPQNSQVDVYVGIK
jgi:predicted transcriptional regulator YdeE